MAFFAWTLACTDPDCAAQFDVYARGAPHNSRRCGYSAGELVDISFVGTDSTPDDDGPDVQVMVRSGPVRTRSRGGAEDREKG
jgi:hypothetical protein